MTPPCPLPGEISAYQEGALPPAESERLERHGLDCLRCREALLLLGSADGGVELPEDALRCLAGIRAKPLRLWRAAAAALLLALGLGWWLRPEAPQSPRSVPIPAPTEAGRAFPSGRLEAGTYLAAGADLLLAPGARAASEGSRRLRPETGMLWLEVSRGEPATLLLPGAVLTLDRGAVAVSLPKAQGLAFLSEAWAGEEPSARVWVLWGEAELEAGDHRSRLEGGMHLSPEGWLPTPAGDAGLAALEAARQSALLSLPGRAVFVPGLALSGRHPEARASGWDGGPYRWATAITQRDPATELRVTLAAGGRWFDWTAGLASRPPRARELVEVVWDGEWLTGRVDGRVVFSADAARAGEVLEQASREGWGLGVWGGSATVAQSTLQETRK